MYLYRRIVARQLSQHKSFSKKTQGMKLFKQYKWIAMLLLGIVAMQGYSFANHEEPTKNLRGVSKIAKKRTFGRQFEQENHLLLDTQEEKDESHEDTHCFVANTALYFQQATVKFLASNRKWLAEQASVYHFKLFILYCVYLI